MGIKPVRTRFAPSPTGSVHIGGMRQALFSWLYARRYNGQFILRIEDTDKKRFVEGSVDLIFEAFDWLHLDIDEGPREGGPYGPYMQSQRLRLYQEWANWLLANDHAYKAFETSEELAHINAEREKKGLSPGYDGRARNLSEKVLNEYEAEGRPYVIRFKMPLEGKTRTTDIIRGVVEFENVNIPDPVILKSDGFPTYHFAHVVDDHFMEISHITRGVEWLPSLPIHWNLFEAFGWDKPVFAHLPLIMDADGRKLSKRKSSEQQGDIPVIMKDFMDAGYLPEAVINFITNIGWNFGDNCEIFTIEETLTRFDLADINKANAAYPIEKLDSLNSHYIQAMNTDNLADKLKSVFEAAGYKIDMELMKQVTPLINTRIKKLTDAPGFAGFFFSDWNEFQAPAVEWMIHKKSNAEEAVVILEKSIEILKSLSALSADTLYEVFKNLAVEMEISNSILFTPLRIAITGQQVHPPIFETIVILGRDETIRRIKLAIDQLMQTSA